MSAVWWTAGNAIMLLAVPLWLLDCVGAGIARAITLMCHWAAAPLVIASDYCIKRSNRASRARP